MMKYNYSYKNGCLLSGFLIALCLPFNYVQAAQALDSQGAWKLQIFSAEEADGIPFCTIYKDYDARHSLFVSLNPMQSMKIILRVPVNEYVIGKKYDLTLSSDTGAKKFFSAVSMSEEGDFDLSLNNEDALFSALSQTQSLEAMIGDEPIIFKTSSLPAAMQDLSSCIEGQDLLPAKTGSAIYNDAQKSVVPPIDRNQLIADYKETQSIVMGEANSAVVVDRPVAKLNLQERDLLESLKRKISILEKEKESLRSSMSAQRQDTLSNLKQTIDGSGEVAACEAKISILEQKIVADNQKSFIEPAKEDVLAVPVAVDLNEVASLKKELSSEQQKTVQLGADLASLREENKIISKRLDESVLAAESYSNSIGLDAAVNQKEVVSLKETLALEQKKTEQLRTDLASLREENMSLANKLSEVPQAEVAVCNNIEVPVEKEVLLLRMQNEAYEKQISQCQN